MKRRTAADDGWPSAVKSAAKLRANEECLLGHDALQSG